MADKLPKKHQYNLWYAVVGLVLLFAFQPVASLQPSLPRGSERRGRYKFSCRRANSSNLAE